MLKCFECYSYEYTWKGSWTQWRWFPDLSQARSAGNDWMLKEIQVQVNFPSDHLTSIGIPLCWFCFPMITTTWFVALQTQHNRSTDSAYGVMHAVFECMFPRVGSIWFRGSTSITLLLFPWSDPQKWLFWCWCNYAPAKKKPSGYGSKCGFQWITLSIRHSLFELSNINRNTIYWCILSTKHMHGI